MAKMAITKIPGRQGIELTAFYDSFEWYYPNCELQTKEWFVKNAQSDWVYIDCGANIGYYSILFSQLSPVGAVHAIEPTSTADMLATNIAHNQCQNVKIHRLAVGQYSGPRVEKIYRIWGAAPEELEYNFTTLDRLVEALDLRKLDCIKIDVDSYDFEVLMGAEKTLERFDPWLIVELNHALAVRGYSNMAVLRWMFDHGYERCLVLDHENFVFRRSAGKVLDTGKGIQLSFPIHDTHQ
jgi:FkbM family methyltransferase